MADKKKRSSKKTRGSGKKRETTSKSRGCSNAGKYPEVKEFCGPAGGACPGTYPVDTEKRAKAALAYARNAPDPKGIRRCVRRVSQKKGWGIGTNSPGSPRRSPSPPGRRESPAKVSPRTSHKRRSSFRKSSPRSSPIMERAKPGGKKTRRSKPSPTRGKKSPPKKERKDELEKMKVTELKSLAGNLNMKGYKSMKKSDLVDAIFACENTGECDFRKPRPRATEVKGKKKVAGRKKTPKNIEVRKDKNGNDLYYRKVGGKLKRVKKSEVF